MKNSHLSLRERVRAHELLIGSFVSAQDPAVVRVAEASGLHFLLLDYEHGLFSPALTARFIDLARHSAVSILVRCTMQQLHEVGALFDRGLTGVLVAGTTSVAEVQEVIRTVKFPSMGNRGLNPFVPAAQFGRMDAPTFMQRSNEQTNVWILVENRKLLAELDALCQLPELDGLFLGPYDLSISLGHPGELDHPKVVDTLQQTVNTICQAGKTAGIFAKDTTTAKRWIERNIRLVAVGFDWQTLQASWSNTLDELRGTDSSFLEV